MDTISKEYGWTDNHILDLTPQRMRQVQSRIVERLELEQRQKLKLEEAKMRILVGAIHAAAGNKKAERIARSIKLVDDSPSKPQSEDLADRNPSVEDMMALLGGA